MWRGLRGFAGCFALANRSVTLRTASGDITTIAGSKKSSALAAVGLPMPLVPKTNGKRSTGSMLPPNLALMASMKRLAM